MTALQAAGFARRLRAKARAARLAGRYDSAAVLYAFAAKTQALALVSDFGATR